MSKTDAQENLNLEIDGADHSDNADFEAAFNQTTSGKQIDETEKVEKNEEKPVVKVDEKPVEEKPVEEKPEDKPIEDDKPKTVEERLAEAAKRVEPVQESKAPAGDILDALPSSYAWARDARANGELAEFLKNQPKAVQNIAMKSDDPEDVMYVLDLFKKSQEAPAPVASNAEAKSILASYGDVKVRQADGSMKTLKAIAEEYGNEDLFESFAAMVKAMQGQQKPVAKTESRDYEAIINQKMAQMKADSDFWDAVTDAHSDGKKLAKSGKVREWAEAGNNDVIKRLFKSPNPDDAILVLDAYKEAMAKLASAATAGQKHKQTVALHSETVRPKKENKTFAGEGSAEKVEDFDDGFDLATKGKK